MRHMHRDPLLRLLTHYLERHPEERACVRRFIDFVRAHPDCFDRTLAVGHVTGSAWLVDDAGGRVLLTHHRKLERWLQLGGHCDGDPDALNVAMREAVEESGLTDLHPVSSEIFDLDIHEIPARGGAPAHLHYDARFAIRSTGDDTFTVSDESHALAWIDIIHLHEKTTEESMLRMSRKWLKRPAAGKRPTDGG